METVEVYKQLRAILSGCDSISDALYISNKYVSTYPHLKQMIISYVNGHTYKDQVDITTKQKMLIDINLCETRNDAHDLIAQYSERTNDDVYKKTAERLANKKKYSNSDFRHFHKVIHINKKCPHCSHIISMPDNTDYVICGYHDTNKGYDWHGCGRDWCFYCGKILCKKWEINELHLPSNRQHDDECCLNYAKENNYKYPVDFCNCNNTYVCRKN
jgi:hypothetical protein